MSSYSPVWEWRHFQTAGREGGSFGETTKGKNKKSRVPNMVSAEVGSIIMHLFPFALFLLVSRNTLTLPKRGLPLQTSENVGCLAVMLIL